jgi:hypothetical protein
MEIVSMLLKVECGGQKYVIIVYSEALKKVLRIQEEFLAEDLHCGFGACGREFQAQSIASW